MALLSFDEQPFWLAAVVFCVCAGVVWAAGTRLSLYADRFSRATGIGGAVVGFVLLGAVTSLPEIATTFTASVAGDANLAVNNLIGGVAMQVTVLAIADVVVRREALTSTVPRPDALAQSAMNIVMLALIAGIIVAGDRALVGLGVGAGSLAIAASYVACVLVARSMNKRAGWRPTGDAKLDRFDASGEAANGEKENGPTGSLPKLLLLIAGAGALIFFAGFLLTRSGEAIAARTGLGSSFFGAVFLGSATSLPELSSAIAAVRLRRPQLAIGDILGGNIFDLALIALVDVVYRGGPVLAEVGMFSAFAACLAIVLHAVFIIGMVERADRTVLRMGYDSAVVLAIYATGLFVLYSLRP